MLTFCARFCRRCFRCRIAVANLFLRRAARARCNDAWDTRQTHVLSAGARHHPYFLMARGAPSSHSPRKTRGSGAPGGAPSQRLRRATGCEPARAAQCALRTRKRAASRRSTCGHFPIPATLFVKRICASLRQPGSWRALRPGGAPGSLATTADEPPPQGPRRRQRAAPGYLPAAPASPKRAKARSMAPSRLACSIKRRFGLSTCPIQEPTRFANFNKQTSLTLSARNDGGFSLCRLYVDNSV